MKYPLIIFFILVLPFSSFSQRLKAGVENWQNLDYTEDKIRGISTEKAYRELLKNKKGVPVIVAVIDGGIQPDHPDLSSVMWVNKEEIKGNRLDDDGNGYIDDINGWNFLGNSEGENVQFDNLEVARLIRDLKPKYVSVLPSTPLAEDDKKEFAKYQEMVTDYMQKLEIAQMGELNLRTLKEALDSITTSIGKEYFLENDFHSYKPKNKVESRAISVVKRGMKDGTTYLDFHKELMEAFEYYTNQVKYHLNMAFNSRDIVNDDYEDSNERYYGNNNIEGPDAFHGTHVAGIIAGDRTNNTAIKGVADQVLIMGLRTVPDGDERDKDVANAIRYAVENGAKVINMSFGKSYAKDKQAVDDAVRYAMENDVLLVQAAGNDGDDIDKVPNFPSRYFTDSLGMNQGEATGWIVVGASSWKSSDVIASFTNYGKRSVDVFAPGVDINSAAPKSTYKQSSGTSMAAPVVAGLAGLIRSHYPKFTAIEVREIIMDSAIKLDGKVKVKDGRVTNRVTLAEISQSGGIVNAYEALKLAEKRAKDRK